MTHAAIGRFARLLTGRSSRRAALLGGGAGLAAGAIGLTGPRVVAARQASDDEFESGGLGLTSDEFEARYGPSEVGQGAIIYEVDGESYAVGGRQGTDLVTSVYWSAPGPETIPLEEGLARITPFLPADAKLREVYMTPAAGIFPFAIVYLYKSAGLARVLAGGPTVTSGNFLVAFQITAELDIRVRGVNAFVGARP